MTTPNANLPKQIDSALALAQKRIRHLIETHPGLYPLFTVAGRWKHNKPAWTPWCDGFLPGMMWLFLESGKADDPQYWRAAAERYAAAIENRKDDRETHALGFIFYHGSHKPWYDFTVREGTPREDVRQVVLHSARILAQRYHADGKYLRSFLSGDSTVIDVVMNVPLFFYAAAELNDQAMLTMAMNITRTLRRTMVRADGSAAQQGFFDLRSGEFLRQATQQGFRGDSSWSRGVAWSLYGFGSCYELSGDTEFLETAESNAKYYLTQSAPDGIPPWDFDAPESGVDSRKQPDSSAAAIAACGLFNLARLVEQPERAAHYRDAAFNIVNTLTQPPYLAADDPEWEGILKRGVYHIHRSLGVDESVLWGEFYFVQALAKALAAL